MTALQTLVLTYDDASVSQDRQLRACMGFLEHAGDLVLAGMLRPGCTAAEAAAAVAAGGADVVLAPYRSAELDLTGEIERVGGQVRYVHKPAEGRLTVRLVLARMHTALGISAEKIARVLDVSLAEVKDHLYRAGIPAPRRPR